MLENGYCLTVNKLSSIFTHTKYICLQTFEPWNISASKYSNIICVIYNQLYTINICLKIYSTPIYLLDKMIHIRLLAELNDFRPRGSHRTLKWNTPMEIQCSCCHVLWQCWRWHDKITCSHPVVCQDIMWCFLLWVL